MTSVDKKTPRNIQRSRKAAVHGDPATSQNGATLQFFTLDGGRSVQHTAPLIKATTGSESSGDDFAMHRRVGLPLSLPRARVGLRLQPVAAATSPNQSYYPDPNRLVCCAAPWASKGGSLFGVTVLAGVYQRPPQGQNKCVCKGDGLLPTSLSPQQPFPSSPFFGSLVFLGANHAMEQKDMLDGRCLVSLGLKYRPAVRKRKRAGISRDSRTPHGIQRRRQTVLTAQSVAGDLHGQPLQRGFFTTGQAFK